MMKWLVPVLALVAVDPLEDPAVKSLDAVYQSAVQKADADAAKIKRTAAEKRLKGYRELLKKFTQAGDFRKASALNDRIKELDDEKDALGLEDRPAGAVRHGQHSYFYIKDELNWHQANRRCEQLKEHLIVIDSPEEMEFALRLSNGKNCWVGATDEKSPGTWKWVDGKGIDVNQLKDIRLDNNGGVQHWLAIKLGCQFVDAGNDLKAPCICEWEK